MSLCRVRAPYALLCALPFACCLAPYVAAQELPWLPLHTDQLPTASGMPAEMQGLVPDTAAQVLFNPALAVRYGPRFVYATYNAPTVVARYDPRREFPTATGPRWQVATVFGQDRPRWLVAAAHGMNEASSGQTVTADELDPFVGGFERVETVSEIRTTTSNGAAWLRVARLRPGGALGAFATYEHARARTRRQTDRRDTFVREGPIETLVSNDWTETDEVEHRREATLSVGLEAAAAGARWQRVATLSYQRTWLRPEETLRLASIRADTVTRSDVNTRTLTVTTEDRAERFRLALPTHAAKADLYLARELRALGGPGHLVATFSALYGGGVPDYRQTAHAERILTRDVGATVRVDTLESEATAVESDPAATFGVARLGVGYLRRARLAGLEVRTGPLLRAEYGRTANLPPERLPSTLEEVALQDRRPFVQGYLAWPLFVRYRPLPPVVVDGGLTYFYRFDRSIEYLRGPSDLDREPTPGPDAPTRSASTRRVSRGLFHGETIFLAVTARHPSGLSLQVDFNGQVTTYRTWTVALGYQF